MTELKEKIKQNFGAKRDAAHALLAQAGKEEGVDFMHCSDHECELIAAALSFATAHGIRTGCELEHAFRDKPFYRSLFANYEKEERR